MTILTAWLKTLTYMYIFVLKFFDFICVKKKVFDVFSCNQLSPNMKLHNIYLWFVN